MEAVRELVNAHKSSYVTIFGLLSHCPSHSIFFFFLEYVHDILQKQATISSCIPVFNNFRILFKSEIIISLIINFSITKTEIIYFKASRRRAKISLPP